MAKPPYGEMVRLTGLAPGNSRPDAGWRMDARCRRASHAPPVLSYTDTRRPI